MYMVQNPPKYDDVICEQPLIKQQFQAGYRLTGSEEPERCLTLELSDSGNGLVCRLDVDLVTDRINWSRSVERTDTP